ncbi:MAG: glycerol-3-phosphate 1-O-acyltransferase PlsY [Clostridia bacterium]|nr:glycerol-3-phosphate 1-O-acyltransferase PlsY [Clostridia bacterium]
MGTQIYVYIVTALLSYFIGSISFSVIICKKIAGFDIREKGSGNAGSTNVLRTIGTKAAVITLIGDILKGIIAILIALWTGSVFKNINPALLVQIAGVSVILGHTFPILFKFKGGKGVATALGVLLISNWQIGLICLVFALVLMICTRMVSCGSVAAAILFPVLTIFISENYLVEGNYFIYSVILAIIIAFNHRKNIKRILNGTERKIGQKID